MKRPPDVSLRPVRAEDRDFLLDVYASTRAEELARVPWSESERRLFVRMQFDAQDVHYRKHYPDCEFLLVLRAGTPIGRLYVDRRSDEIRVVDIALLPEHRRAGIGSALMKQVIAEAEAAGLPVRIHVEHFNPALALYRRLGFRPVADQGVYLLMECPPRSSS